MDKCIIETPKVPEIENLAKITPEQAMGYVLFVAHVRHTQRRYFALRRPERSDGIRRLRIKQDFFVKFNEKCLEI